MAYDKVVDSTVLNTGLTKIANAIREKGGTSASLSFPDAMATAIAAIEAGGGGLPDGVTAVATGTFTPATDTVGEFISHGLGVTPTFVYYYAEGSIDINDFGGYVIGGIIAPTSILESGHTLCGYTLMYYGWKSPSGDVGWDTQYTTYYDEEITEMFLINDTGFVPGFESSTNIPVKAGVTYKWVACTMK